jgi:hypothetical protein
MPAMMVQTAAANRPGPADDKKAATKTSDEEAIVEAYEATRFFHIVIVHRGVVVAGRRPSRPPTAGRIWSRTAAMPNGLAVAARSCRRTLPPPPHPSPPHTAGAPRAPQAARESVAMPTESPHSHLITLPPHQCAAPRLAAEESF